MLNGNDEEVEAMREKMEARRKKAKLEKVRLSSSVYSSYTTPTFIKLVLSLVYLKSRSQG